MHPKSAAWFFQLGLSIGKGGWNRGRRTRQSSDRHTQSHERI